MTPILAVSAPAHIGQVERVAPYLVRPRPSGRAATPVRPPGPRNVNGAGGRGAGLAHNVRPARGTSSGPRVSFPYRQATCDGAASAGPRLTFDPAPPYPVAVRRRSRRRWT